MPSERRCLRTSATPNRSLPTGFSCMTFMRSAFFTFIAVFSSMVYPACPHPLVDTSQWSTVNVGPFKMRAPDDYRQDKTQGYDSQVGRWKAEGEWVLYDFGPYTEPPANLDRYRDVNACDEEIGGRQARIATYRKQEGGYVVAAHWADTGKGDKRLSVIGEARNPAGRDRLLAVVRSVLFEP